MDWNTAWSLFIDFWLFSEQFIGRAVMLLTAVWLLLLIAEALDDWLDKALAPKRSKY